MPIAKDNYEGMQELKAKSSIPFYADEACVTENDVIRCKNAFHGITIKLSKCGGITPALRMIKEARSFGLSIMLGNMNECSIGTAPLLHLQYLVDKMDADGPLLLIFTLYIGQGCAFIFSSISAGSAKPMV